MNIRKILHFSIYNPWIVLGLTGIAAFFGYMSLKDLPIDAVPDVTNNQVQINLVKEGFSPLEMEKQITLPIENSLAGIPGLEETRSLTRNGFTQITAIFEDHVNIYFARQQITERIEELKGELPEGLELKLGPLATGLSEVAMWIVRYAHPDGLGASIEPGKPGWQVDSSYLTPEGTLLKTEKEQAAYLREVQDWVIRPQLKNIKGLASIDSIGGYVKQIEIVPDLNKLTQLNVGLNELTEVLNNSLGSAGPGSLNQTGEAFLVRVDGKIKSVEELNNLVLFQRALGPIRLKDIATVKTGFEPRYGSSSANGEEVVTGTALMLMGANSRTVSLAVQEKIEKINPTLPKDIIAEVVLTRSELVDSTIRTVVTNLSEGALLVIAVLFLFLGNFRAALITSMVIPLSMLLTGIGMFYGKISGNLMSLGAIDFGLIVDGAVIITENALTRMKQGIDSRESLLNACIEMIRPSLFGQLIILIVYGPILLLGGVEGRMFHPMAWTVIFALISAFILSITFIPAALSLFLKQTDAHENKLTAKLKNLYQPLLEASLAKPLKLVTFGGATLVLASLFYLQLGSEFVPALDEKNLALQAMRIPSTSIDTSTDMQREVEKAVMGFDEVKLVFSKTGTAEMATDPMTPNLSDTFVILKPRSEWPDPSLDKNELIEAMEERLFKVPGNNYEFTQPIQLRFNELIGGVKSDVAVKLYGDDFEKLGEATNDIAHALSHLKGAKDIKVGQTDGLPTLDIQYKRESLSRYGIPLKEGIDLIQTAIQGSTVGQMVHGDRSFDIVVRLTPPTLQSIGLIPLKSNISFPTFIPLKELANINTTSGLNEIKREQGKRFQTVEVNVRGRDLGSFIEDLEKTLATLSLPKGYWIEIGGQYDHLLSSKKKLETVIPLSFGLILLLLYAALKSLRLSLIVFTGVPFAWVGGILALWFTGIPFSISAAVGFIALSGIAVLNGLVLLTAIEHRLKRESLHDAIFQGSLERLRPVLMTALVAMLGFLPMALSNAPGAEVQKPLAIVVIGGLFSSTLLTLLILPALTQLIMRRKYLQNV